jgi:hypothetical protein
MTLVFKREMSTFIRCNKINESLISDMTILNDGSILFLPLVSSIGEHWNTHSSINSFFASSKDFITSSESCGN